MAHKKAPLSGRDLIRYLPDLLTGKEPVFDDPAVQRFITQDPEGRAAVGLIADTAAALTVAHDRVATQTYAAIKPLRESVLAAKKYAKRQLADLLFYEGMRRLKAGLRLDDVEVFTESADLSTEPFPTESDAEMLIAQLDVPGIPAAPITLLLKPSNLESKRELLGSALEMFGADVELVPGRDGSSVMREIAADNSGHRRSARHWEAVAAALQAPIARAAAIDRAALRHCASGASTRATTLSRELSRVAPHSLAFQAHALIISLVTGDLGLVDSCGDRVASGARAFPSAWQKALDSFKADINLLTKSFSREETLRCRSRIECLDSTLRPLSEGLRT
jgi:hypothetical protein